MRKLPMLFCILAGLSLLAPATMAHSRSHHGVSVWIHGGGWWPGPVYAPIAVSDWAFVDTDIAPGDAEVWLNGEYIGVVDRYDGWPAYLEVPPGEHRLEFRHEGYRTLRVDLRARPGRVYRFDRQLRPLRPGEGADEDPPVSGPPEPQPPPPAGTRIFLDVRPDDAVVYVDGELWGPARSIERDGGIELTEGEHVVEVVRAGYRPWKRRLSLDRDETRRLRIALVPE